MELHRLPGLITDSIICNAKSIDEQMALATPPLCSEMSGAVVSRICGYIYPGLAHPLLTAGTEAAADGGLRSSNWRDFHWWWVSTVSPHGQITARQ